MGFLSSLETVFTQIAALLLFCMALLLVWKRDLHNRFFPYICLGSIVLVVKDMPFFMPVVIFLFSLCLIVAVIVVVRSTTSFIMFEAKVKEWFDKKKLFETTMKFMADRIAPK